MNAQIYQEASEWLIEFRTDEAPHGKRRAFQSWLDASPEHVRAYLELTSVWEDSSSLDRFRQLNIESLIALSRTEDNIVDLDDADTLVSRSPLPRTRERDKLRSSGSFYTPSKHQALAVSISILLICAATAGYWNTFQRGTYTTDIGQQQTLTLPDGTTVELNANTRIRKRYTSTLRTVELLRGQALFNVAKNPKRPFTVLSADTKIRAVGTQFDVKRKSGATMVTVIEGSVAVLAKNSLSRSAIEDGKDGRAGTNSEATGTALSDGRADRGYREAAAGAEIVLIAGQQTIVTSRAVAQPTRANIAVATAWTRQKLIFEAVTLTEAAEEFNRFSTRKLVVNSAGLEDFRINGTFPALDPASLSRFLSFLRAQPGIVVIESDERVRIEKSR